MNRAETIVRASSLTVTFALTIALASWWSPARAAGDKRKPAGATAPAARLNGTYRSGDSEIKILAGAAGDKLRVELTPVSGSASGFAAGEAALRDDVATYSSAELGPCTITMKFLPGNKLTVTQQGSDADCGFGHNVTADGTYVRTKTGAPRFGGPEPAPAPPGPASASAAKAPAGGALTPVPPKEVFQRYGKDADGALQKLPAIAAAIKQLDPDFEGLGTSGDNSAVRLADGKEILLLCGRAPRAMGEAQYHIAYDVTRRLVYFDKVPLEEAAKPYGTPDPKLKAALATIAGQDCRW